MFKAEFSTGNAAFQDGDGSAEVARILRAIAERVEEGESGAPVRDSNGNTVGAWSLNLHA